MMALDEDIIDDWFAPAWVACGCMYTLVGEKNHAVIA